MRCQFSKVLGGLGLALFAPAGLKTLLTSFAPVASEGGGCTVPCGKNRSRGCPSPAQPATPKKSPLTCGAEGERKYPIDSEACMSCEYSTATCFQALLQSNKTIPAQPACLSIPSNPPLAPALVDPDSSGSLHSPDSAGMHGDLDILPAVKDCCGHVRAG